MSKEKGKVGERELARELARVLGVGARRGVQYCGGPDSPDVVTDLPDIHIECKRTERLRLFDAIEQATRDAGEKVPIVLHRQNRKPWVAIVKLDDLPKLANLIATIPNNETGTDTHGLEDRSEKNPNGK